MMQITNEKANGHRSGKTWDGPVVTSSKEFDPMRLAIFILLHVLITPFLCSEPIEGAQNQYGRWRRAAPGEFVPVNSPRFIDGVHVNLASDTEVIGVSINGDSRAYPLRLMTYHHVVNDTVGELPVSVTYCVMASTAIVYERGQQSSGLEAGGLFGGVLALREIGTEKCFAQIATVPLPEEIATTETLRISAPSILTTWGEWRTQYPETKVLQPLDDYELRYLAFDRRSKGFVANTKMNNTIVHHDERLDPGSEIFGVAVNGKSKAFLLDEIEIQKKIEATIDNQPLTVLWNEELRSPMIEDSFDGFALQAYWYAWSQFYPETELH